MGIESKKPNANQKQDSRYGVDLARREAIGPQEEVEDHGADHSGHDGGAHEEGVAVLEGSARRELEYEVVVDPRALPQEQVAPVHEQVQAQQGEDTAPRNGNKRAWDQSYLRQISIVITENRKIQYIKILITPEDRVDSFHVAHVRAGVENTSYVRQNRVYAK